MSITNVWQRVANKLLGYWRELIGVLRSRLWRTTMGNKMNRYDDIVERLSKMSSETAGGTPVLDMAQMNSNRGGSFVRMSREDARANAVGLSVAGLRGTTGMVHPIHVQFWDAMGRHLLVQTSLYMRSNSSEAIDGFEWMAVRDLFITIVMLNSRVLEMQPCGNTTKWNEIHIPPFSTSPEAYMIYPLLEAVLKLALFEFIKLNGQVKKEFPRGFQKNNEYKPTETCSNVGDLLRLYMNQPKFNELAGDLQRIFDHIKMVHNGRNAITVITQDWRNPVVHGQVSVPRASGVMLNIVLLVALSNIDESQWDARYKEPNLGTE